MSSSIQLIVGLGNPGSKYEQTRHNVGFWFIDEVARLQNTNLKSESKMHGAVVKTQYQGQELWLLKPGTYMNNSGQSVGALCRFYKIKANNILVVHDELDLPAGTVRLKVGGGHGGHNGLRDIIAHLGDKNFNRLRLGIDHPGSSHEVANYVLKKPSIEQKIEMDRSIERVLAELPDIVCGEFQKVMNILHRQ